MAKKRKNGLKKVMEVLDFYGAVEITEEDIEKNPKLRASVESDRKWLLENTKLPKKIRQKIETS
jgi:hypothetical protein